MSTLLTLEVSGERNMGRLPAGEFTQTLVSTRVRVNVSPDLSMSSYVQYDTVSDAIGVNTCVRWTFKPEAGLFVVYNHNVRSVLDRWPLESNQLVMKGWPQRQTMSPSSMARPISAPAPAPMIVPSTFDPPGAMMLPSTPPATPPTIKPVVPSSLRQ